MLQYYAALICVFQAESVLQVWVLLLQTVCVKKFIKERQRQGR